MSIFCPLCAWRPQPSSRWLWRPGCLTSWNTFDTHAPCPGCGKQWRETWCPQCHLPSPHDDWYHEDILDQAEEIVRIASERPELIPV